MRNYTVESFVNDLKSTLGNKLLSVAMYGSSASGETTKHFSDINLLIVSDDLSPETLETMRPWINRWRKAGHAFPILFTPKEIAHAADVFTIEFLDIKEAHKILHGVNYFETLSIRGVNLKHQLEYELRTKLLKLRATFVEWDGHPKSLAVALAKSLSSFTTLFRSTLRLSGIIPPSAWPAVWRAVQEKVNIDVAALETIFKLRENPREIPKDIEALYGRLLTSVSAVTEFVDSAAPAKNI